MFRIPVQEDPAEERRKVRETVKSNLFTFLAMCVAIRISKYSINSKKKHDTFEF